MVDGDVVHDANLARGDKSDVRSVSQGHGDGERGAGTVVVARGDRAVMLLNDPSRNREAQAPAFVRPGGVGLIEAFEDALEIVRWDAAAVVGNGDQAGGIELLQPQLDGATRPGELHRIVDQDPEELGDRVCGDGGPGRLWA